MKNEINPTEKQINEAVKFLRHWNKKSVFKYGYWFKLIGDVQVEISNEEETVFKLVDLHKEA